MSEYLEDKVLLFPASTASFISSYPIAVANVGVGRGAVGALVP